MKIIILKIISVICLAFLAVVSFGLGGVPLLEGKHLFDPYLDTEFAENYSPKKFDSIKIGMTIDEVTHQIGEPLSKTKNYLDSTNTDFRYTNDGKLRRLAAQKGQRGWDLAWYLSMLTFDKNGKVISITKEWNYD